LITDRFILNCIKLTFLTPSIKYYEKRTVVSLLLLLSASMLNSQSINDSQLPFDMPPVEIPVSDRIHLICHYGAKPDGITLNTSSIISAIEACNRAGGGVVLVPRGLWLTGPVKIRKQR